MKKKLIIISLIICVIIVASIIGLYIYINYRDSQIYLTDESVVIEYGNVYEPTIYDLIDIEKYSFINLDKINIENAIVNEDDKNYPSVGTYNIYVYYKDIELVQNVEIIDSSSPVITVDEKIELDYGTDVESYDFSSYITITDLSETEYNIDLSNVNSEIAGEYTAILTAKDIYSNENQKEFKIIIKEKIEEINTDNVSSNNVNNTQEKTSSQTTTTNKNTSQSTGTSTSSSSQTDTTNKQQSASQVEETTTQTQTSTETVYWCTDGGTHHVAGDDVNEHGYYSTWDLAWNACQEYMKNLDSSCHYKVSQCWCGLYYFWVEEN